VPTSPFETNGSWECRRWAQLALTVAMGLLAAVLSVPAMSVPHPMASTEDMQTMADDMPCCPD
jgi:hypothetical protein